MATKNKITGREVIKAKLSTGTLYIGEKYKVFINNKRNGEDIEIYSKDNDEWIPLDEKVTKAIYRKIKKQGESKWKTHKK